MNRLSELKDGDKAIIININSTGEYSKRLSEMGFIKGRRITVIKNAPLKDPIEYELMGYSISLRRREASMIEVKLESQMSPQQIAKLSSGNFEVSKSNDLGVRNTHQNKVIRVALVGNPNCGKTTFFNKVSGLDEHVGNFSGVTVELKDATFNHRGYKINITDLPGTYSLSTYSPEEKIVKQELSSDKYDFVINLVDATLLERNLYLTTQLMDMACHIVVSLNMYDELQLSGDRFDHELLSQMLDIPFIPTSARSGDGVSQVLDMIIKMHENERPHTHVESSLGGFIEERVATIAKRLENEPIAPNMPRRYLALALIQGDDILEGELDKSIEALCLSARREIEEEYDDNISQVVADARYGYIAGALAETLVVDGERNRKSQSIDSILTHRIWGLPIFMLVIWLMFYTTFTLGAYPQEWIDMGVGALSDYLSSVMQAGALKELVIDGIIGGVGSVIIFLPNILILFLFISLMEDSGYMSRAAFIMDKLMHRIGLHGKSFVPMIMGFGCNVPAIMASRIIEDKNNRMLTILIIPFMSCSARLPVYILLIGAFFPSCPSLMLFGLYLFGVILAIVTSMLFKRLFFTGADHPFVMELPPYRLPLMRNTLKHMWNKGGQYLKKMGGVILVGAVIIWALGNYPSKEDSYLEKIGHGMEPTIAPLGFDWKMGVSLISGIAAKEVAVSTLGVLYNIDESPEGGHGDDELAESKLQEKLKADRYQTGKHKGELIYKPHVALAYLLFVLIYFPCLAVIAAIRRECGSWSWALLSLLYTTGLAWVVSFAVYNIGALIVK